jgi:alcohol dehydrogenase class IV
MAEIITFSPAPSVLGFGALNKLPEILGSRGVKHLLIITDSHIADSGILERVLDMLKDSIACKLFTGVPAEFSSSDIDAQKEHFGSDFDALLGLGGGSSMDFAKAMAIIMTHGGTLGDYLGEGSVPDAVIPVICVPTTSGTGSQNTQTTVFTIAGVKRGVSSEYIRPAASIVDPELTMGLPSEVTRNSGYDALMHACESYFTRPNSQVPERPILYQGSNPFSRSLSLEAFVYIWRSYQRAVSEGGDRGARLDMSTGSHLAGLAFSHSGLGLVHALASAVGGMVDAPHGVCLAACTNIGLSYNFKVCEKDFATLADVMCRIDGTTASSAGGEIFLEKIQDLIKTLDFPSRPSELGLGKEDAEKLLENTLVQTRRTKTNPRTLDDELLSHIRDGI